jgi:co-chaperonin GroES (HSP10)
MKALEYFTVKLDKAIKDTITTESGLELYIDTRFKEFDNRVTEGPIHTTPAKFKTDAKEGDTLYFHHLVVIGEGQRFPDTRDLYMVKYCDVQVTSNQAIAFKSQDTGEIHPLFGWSLISPLEEKPEEDTNGIRIVKLKAVEVTQGEVTICSPQMKEMGLSKGDVVGFKKNRDYRITIDGKEYYRVALSELLYKEV